MLCSNFLADTARRVPTKDLLGIAYFYGIAVSIAVDITVWDGIVGQSEDVVCGGMIEKRKTNEERCGNLPFSGFVKGIGILRNIQIGCNILLCIAVLFSERSYSHKKYLI